MIRLDDNPNAASPTLTKPSYQADDLRVLRAFLTEQGTFDFPIRPTGLFSAARLSAGAEYTGYRNVWVRDNVHIAHAHLHGGQAGAGIAAGSMAALTRYFTRHRRRFEAVIRTPRAAESPMNRPHVRFDGDTLDELPETWSHAQNDALGYYLWLTCKLAASGHLSLSAADWQVLALFPLYFEAVRYWQDEDSGHWEEARKVSASSIGAVLAGLRELRRLMAQQGRPEVRVENGAAGGAGVVTLGLIDSLMEQGRSALGMILPNECVQEDPLKRRAYDAALLFLIYPLEVVDGGSAMAARIIDNTERHLQGEHGVRRYLGDSFWCADYKELQSAATRTADFSGDMSARDSLLRPGEEAQWCIFDPILSAIHGRRYAETGRQSFLDRQTHYFNRALTQLTAPADPAFEAYRCPELYYLERGKYVPNDVTPLLWTQANLSLAFDWMERSATHPSTSPPLPGHLS